VEVRKVLNAVFYVLSTGCQWSAPPKDLPPKSTVWDYFSRWEWDHTIERVHHTLYVAVCEQAGREASRTAAIIDSQTAKAKAKAKAKAAQTYCLPRLQAAFAPWPGQSASTYPVSGTKPGQDGDPRIPSLIKGPASGAILRARLSGHRSTVRPSRSYHPQAPSAAASGARKPPILSMPPLACQRRSSPPYATAPS
jgi:transposase